MADAVAPPAGNEEQAGPVVPDMAPCSEALLKLAFRNVSTQISLLARSGATQKLARTIGPLPEEDFPAFWEDLRDKASEAGANITDAEIEASEEPRAMLSMRSRCQYNLAFINYRAMMAKHNIKVSQLISSEERLRILTGLPWYYVSPSWPGNS
jgi:hypothetical protein